LDNALTTGLRQGRETAQGTARIEFTVASTAELQQMTVRIGYALERPGRHEEATRGSRRWAERVMIRTREDVLADEMRRFVSPATAVWLRGLPAAGVPAEVALAGSAAVSASPAAALPLDGIFGGSNGWG
jgi:hypothetical protein